LKNDDLNGINTETTDISCNEKHIEVEDEPPVDFLNTYPNILDIKSTERPDDSESNASDDDEVLPWKDIEDPAELVKLEWLTEDQRLKISKRKSRLEAKLKLQEANAVSLKADSATESIPPLNSDGSSNKASMTMGMNLISRGAQAFTKSMKGSGSSTALDSPQISAPVSTASVSDNVVDAAAKVDEKAADADTGSSNNVISGGVETASPISSDASSTKSVQVTESSSPAPASAPTPPVGLSCLRCSGIVAGPKYSTCRCSVPALTAEDLKKSSGKSMMGGFMSMFRSASSSSTTVSSTPAINQTPIPTKVDMNISVNNSVHDSDISKESSIEKLNEPNTSKNNDSFSDISNVNGALIPSEISSFNADDSTQSATI
jgi:hypothetical protein